MIDRRRRRETGEATLVPIRRPQRDLVDDTDNGRRGTLARIEPEVTLAAGDDKTDVGICKTALRDALGDDAPQFRGRHGDVEQDRFGGVVQAREVLLQLPDAAVVDADAFEDAVAVEQAVVVDRYHGVVAVVVLPVYPD